MAKKKDSFGDSPVGSGGRFAECVRTMRRRKNVEDPEGLCASIGRKKYGKRRFQEMASKGRKAAGNPFVPDWQVRQIARHIAENTMMFVLPSDTRAIAEAAAEELWELTGERPRRSLVLHVVKLARYYYEALKRSTKRHHMEDNPFGREVNRWREIREKARRLRELAYENNQPEMQAYWQGWEHAIHQLHRIAMKRDASGREGFDVPAQEFDRLFRQAAPPVFQENPLTDAEHQEADRRAHKISNRMRNISYREGRLGNQDGADYWEGQETFIRGAGWAHNRAAQGSVFPSDLYESTSGMDDHEAELLVDEREAAGPEANPVKADGKWHRSTLNDWQRANQEPVALKTHKMVTAKGLAECIPYKPRRYESSATLAGWYERRHGQKVPKGTRWLLWVRPAGVTHRSTPFGAFPSSANARGVTDNVTAHKTLDDAKRAGENALRKLPMPNPAPRLVNEGLLAGSRPIPSGLDSPRYNEGILAGSRPIPSGLDSPRVNVGIVDPPITRRSKPEQPF